MPNLGGNYPYDKNENFHPWHDPYFSVMKDAYHPFLYNNCCYYELTARGLAALLHERDIYVKTIQIDVMDALLTNPERAWVHFLRNCCLFETHRRRWKFVLSEMMAVVRRREDKLLDTSDMRPYVKVRQWLANYPSLFNITDPDQEDLEYQRLNYEYNRQTVMLVHRPDLVREFQQREMMGRSVQYIKPDMDCEVLFQKVGRAPSEASEPHDDCYVAMECVDQAAIMPSSITEKIRAVCKETAQVSIIRSATPIQQNAAAAIPPVEDDYKPLADRPRERVFYEEYLDEAAAMPPVEAVNKPSTGRSRELVLYEDYPRDFFYGHPELFEIHSAESLGKLLCDREYVKEREGRKEELKEMARQRDIALAKYYEEKAKIGKDPNAPSPTEVKLLFTGDNNKQSPSINFHSSDEQFNGDEQIPSTSYNNNDDLRPSRPCHNLQAPRPSTASISSDENEQMSSRYNENVDRSKGAIRKQYSSKKKFAKNLQQAPPIPNFTPSSNEEKAAGSDDSLEMKSGDSYHHYYKDYLKETRQLSDDSDEPLAVPLEESDISDSEFEIDCTLPPIEPDFMNLPLPETPKEKKYE